MVNQKKRGGDLNPSPRFYENLIYKKYRLRSQYESFLAFQFCTIIASHNPWRLMPNNTIIHVSLKVGFISLLPKMYQSFQFYPLFP